MCRIQAIHQSMILEGVEKAKSKSASILFINNNKALFDASDGGPSNRSNLFIEALTQFGDVDVVSFFSETESNLPRCTVIYSKAIPKYISPCVPHSRCGRLFKFLRLFTTRPSDLYSKTEAKATILNDLIKKKRYDFIACRYFEEVLECDLLKFSDRLILDLDDNPIKAYMRQRGIVLRDNSCSLRYNKYNEIFSLIMERRINRILKSVYCVFHSNPTESQAANSIFLHNLSTIKEGVIPLRESTPLRVIMVGFWAYRVNEKGVRHFAKNIWPKVQKKIPNAQFHVIGPHMSVDLKEFLDGYKGIVVKGFVKDIYREYEECRAVVVPIYEGTGTSIKTVEALMVGRPVVSTGVGIRGFSEKLIAGEDYVLADDDDTFAEGVVSLLLNKKDSEMMAKRAFVKFKQNWSKEEFMKIVWESVAMKNSK